MFEVGIFEIQQRTKDILMKVGKGHNGAEYVYPLWAERSPFVCGTQKLREGIQACLLENLAFRIISFRKRSSLSKHDITGLELRI